MIREEAIESFKCSNEQAKLRLEVEKMRMESGEIKELKFYIERDEMAIKALEQEPKTGWIPITKRLPEEREWIGTKKFGTTKSDEVYVTLRSSDGKYITDHTHFYNGKPSVNMVHLGFVPIAWMPLPKPYDPQESEEV